LAAAVAGQNLGAGQPERAIRGVQIASRLGMGVAAFVGAFFLLIPEQLLAIFGLDDPNVVAIGTQLLRYLAVSGFFITVALTYTGGLQGTAQNLGASLGTALIGAILLIGLTSSFANRIEENEDLPAEVRTTLSAAARDSGLEIIAVPDVAVMLTEAGVPPDQVTEITEDYAAAQLDGLRLSLGAVALFALLGMVFTRRLPDGSTARTDAQAPSGATAAA
jgi:hypothetical protein